MALYLTEAEVRGLLDMEDALAALEAVHADLARGEAIDYPRQRVRSGSAMLHMLQGGWLARGVMGYKAYTSSAAGNRFWVHLFDAADGMPLAVLEANWLGMMRTGAAGGLGARWLARPDARRAAVFGAGWQARGQILALATARPIERFEVFARDRDKLAAFCAEMQALCGREVSPAADAEAMVRAADVLVTITSAPKPLFDGHWLAPGCHVTAAGSNSLIRREIDETTVRRAALVCVDARATALREAGDLLPPLEKGRLSEGSLVELGEIVAGLRSGRRTPDEITLFESQGMAIQDIAVAQLVYQRALVSGVGSPLPY